MASTFEEIVFLFYLGHQRRPYTIEGHLPGESTHQESRDGTSAAGFCREPGSTTNATKVNIHISDAIEVASSVCGLCYHGGNVIKMAKSQINLHMTNATKVSIHM
jgi:hypothetical protein